LLAIEIDRATIAPGRAYMEQERDAAIRDLLADNVFAPAGRAGEGFHLRLSSAEGRLIFAISDSAGALLVTHALSLAPLKRVVRDYFLVCDSYYAGLKQAGAARVEAIDMGRRGLHDEGAEILRSRLAGKVTLDHVTARRLFTLVAALHWKG
jgi:uncharacterized protein (UPF0262 family)